MITLGRAKDAALAARFAKAMAAELLAVGITLDFAPVLDVLTNAKNPAIGDRALSERVEDVATLGRALIEAFQGAGLAAAGKHFPGHGDTGVDSHHDLPICELPPDRLRAVELVPFRAAIAADVAVMLTCHVLFTEIDDEHPATLSPRIVQAILKDELGYQGAVITDDLDMKAIAARYTIEETVVRCLRAGCDGFLICNGDYDKKVRALEAVIREAEGGHGVRQARRGRDDADAPAQGALPGRAPAQPEPRTGSRRWRRSSIRWWPRRCGSGCEARRGRGGVATAGLRRPRALRPGDRLAVVAPASPCAEDAVRRGVRELETLGFEVTDRRARVRAGRRLPGRASRRCAPRTCRRRSPIRPIAGIVCVRGGYGSAQILPLLDAAAIAASPKVFVGYSDITALHTFLQQQAGLVSFHGPMLEGRFADRARYDRDSFVRAVCGTEPMGAIVPPALEIWRAGEASGMLVGGTLTQLASSLGTPWAFDPPPGLRAVLRRGQRAALPAGSAADAAGAGRASSAAPAPSSSTSCPAATSPAAQVQRRRRRPPRAATGSPGRSSAASRPATRRARPSRCRSACGPRSWRRGRAALVIEEPAVEG